MLAIHNGHDIERLQVVAIFRDWQRSKAERDEKYPQSNVKIIEIPVWDNDFAMAYIAERVGMHQAAVNGDEVQCSDEERWYAGSTFALMKEGNKRATKVADTREELGEPAKGFFIEERKGGYRRCEGYCEVAPFCPQLAREREQQEKANA